jgi:hypothetical protein
MKVRHWVFAVSFVLTVSLGALVVGLLYDATFTQPESTRIQAVTALQLDDAFNPIEPSGVFRPDDVFYLSVRVENAPAHSIVSARWFYEDSVVMTQDQVTGALSNVYVLGFELSRTDESWPPGDYAAEILLNGMTVGNVEFAVVVPE